MSMDNFQLHNVRDDQAYSLSNFPFTSINEITEEHGFEVPRTHSSRGVTIARFHKQLLQGFVTSPRKATQAENNQTDFIRKMFGPQVHCDYSYPAAL